MVLAFAIAGPAAAAEEDDGTDALLEQVGFERMERAVGDAAGIDARRLLYRALSGDIAIDAAAIKKSLKALLHALARSFRGMLWTLACPVLASLAIRVLLGERGGTGVLLICRAACAGALMSAFSTQRAEAEKLLRAISEIVDGVAPVLISASALSDSASPTMLAPLSAFGAAAIDDVLTGVAMPLCSFAAVVVAAGSLSDDFRLRRLFGLLRGVIAWGIGALMAALTGTMALEGLIGANQGAAANQTLRFAVRNTLPIVGGELSSAVDALAGSLRALKRAIGATGVLMLAHACARPLLSLAASALAVKLAAAVMEPVSDRCMADCAAQFGNIADILLAITAGAAAIALIVIGACFALTGFIYG